MQKIKKTSRTKLNRPWRLPSRLSWKRWAAIAIGTFAGIGAILVLITWAAGDNIEASLSSSTASPVERNQTIRYSVKFKNNRNNSINFNLKVNKPSYTAYASDSNKSWNGSLGAGQTFNTTFKLVVDANAPCSQLLSTSYSYSFVAAKGGEGSGTSNVISHRAVDKCAAITSFTASKSSLYVGQSITLSWRTSNVSTCTAGGSWSGTKAASGSQTIKGPSQPQTRTYSLSCPSKYAGYSGAGRSISVKYSSRPTAPSPNPTPSPAPAPSPVPAPAPDTNKPSPPSSFKVSEVTTAGVLLTWKAATDKGSGISHYVMQRSLDKRKWLTLNSKITTLNYRDSQVKANTDYYYRLYAVDKAGNKSATVQLKYSAPTEEIVEFTNTILSPDNLLAVDFAPNTFKEDASCTITGPEEVAALMNLPKLTLLGSYTLSCQTASGQPALFQQPAPALLNLDADSEAAVDKLKSYQDTEIAYATTDEQLTYLPAAINMDVGALAFEIPNPGAVAAIGNLIPAKASWLRPLLTILILLGSGLGTLLILNRRRRLKAIEEYQRLYKQYEIYGQPHPSAPPSVEPPQPLEPASESPAQSNEPYEPPTSPPDAAAQSQQPSIEHNLPTPPPTEPPTSELSAEDQQPLDNDSGHQT